MANIFQSSNPLLSEQKITSASGSAASEGIFIQEKATISGAATKTFILFGLMLITALVSYMMPSSFLMIAGSIGGLIAVLVASFKPTSSPVAAPVYALFEGLVIGSVSAYFAQTMDGIIFQATSLTMGTLLTMLVIYKTGIIQVTNKFRMVVAMATGAIFFVYLINMIMGFFGMNIPFLHDSSWTSIGISIFIIVVASMNLLLDFDSFEKAEKNNAPKYMEWFCALGLMVTLIWLYLEFLRLLSKINDR
jgi:uncharacterized YccA/Bax inhibitor family protein